MPIFQYDIPNRLLSEMNRRKHIGTLRSFLLQMAVQFIDIFNWNALMILKSCSNNQIFPIVTLRWKNCTRISYKQIPVHNNIHAVTTQLLKIIHNAVKHSCNIRLPRHLCFKFYQKRIICIFGSLINNLCPHMLAVIHSSAIRTATALSIHAFGLHITFRWNFFPVPYTHQYIHTGRANFLPVQTHRGNLRTEKSGFIQIIKSGHLKITRNLISVFFCFRTDSCRYIVIYTHKDIRQLALLFYKLPHVSHTCIIIIFSVKNRIFIQFQPKFFNTLSVCACSSTIAKCILRSTRKYKSPAIMLLVHMMHQFYDWSIVVNTDAMKSLFFKLDADYRQSGFMQLVDNFAFLLLICNIAAVQNNAIILGKIRQVINIILPDIVQCIFTPVSVAIVLIQRNIQISFADFPHNSSYPGIRYQPSPAI